MSKIAAALVAALVVLAGCGSGSSGTGDKTVVIATHDSWAVPKQVLADFTAKTGYHVKQLAVGDAGELTNKLVLTKGNPIADATYGIDNTFATRAVDAGVLQDFTPSDLPASADPYALSDPKAAKQLTPVDWGDVCVNVDDSWFTQHHLVEPTSLDDLADPRYKNLFVTPGATTSSPGFAFLLATIGKYGTGWQDYWTKLMANGTKVVEGWTDAYEVDYSGADGHGDRPIVLSYNSSPVDTIPKGGSKPTTHALLDTCFRQVEYAGVLAGAKNVAGAEAFVSFMTQREFQQAMPANMYVFPVNSAAPLPATWTKWAPPASQPIQVPPADITSHRDEWLREWGDLTSG